MTNATTAASSTTHTTPSVEALINAARPYMATAHPDQVRALVARIEAGDRSAVANLVTFTRDCIQSLERRLSPKSVWPKLTGRALMEHEAMLRGERALLVAMELRLARMDAAAAASSATTEAA